MGTQPGVGGVVGVGGLGLRRVAPGEPARVDPMRRGDRNEEIALGIGAH